MVKSQKPENHWEDLKKKKQENEKQEQEREEQETEERKRDKQSYPWDAYLNSNNLIQENAIII